MRSDRRSTEEEPSMWWEEEEGVAMGEEETGWRCWKHPLQPPYGVCPACLRDRLLRLCPDCANDRPCGCLPSPSSSASSSSLSSADLAGSGAAAGVGAVGPVSQLIESEPAIRRSRSVGLPLLRSRSVAATPAVAVDEAAQRRRGDGKGWASFWPFSKGAAGKKEPAGAELYRSKSVAAGRSTGAAGCGKGVEKEGREKGRRRWYFPSPMKVFRHRKSTTKVVQERSPMWRG